MQWAIHLTQLQIKDMYDSYSSFVGFSVVHLFIFNSFQSTFVPTLLSFLFSIFRAMVQLHTIAENLHRLQWSWEFSQPLPPLQLKGNFCSSQKRARFLQIILIVLNELYLRYIIIENGQVKINGKFIILIMYCHCVY